MTLNVVHDPGDRPAPVKLPPKLANAPDAPAWAVQPKVVPAKVIDPTPMIHMPPPVKKAPPILPVPKPKPKTGKYGDLAPSPAPKPYPKYY